MSGVWAVLVLVLATGAGYWCWLLVTSGHVTINPTLAVPAWVPDLEWVRGATWVVSGVMTIETFTSTSCHLNIV